MRMTLKTEGDLHVVVTSRFNALPEAVYRAHTDTVILKKWMLGPEGWTMPVCINEARHGGRIRYEWSDGQGNGFYLTGEFVELVPYSRIVHVETMFLKDGSGTLMTMRMTLPDADTRAAMLATGMEDGMEASYVRLEALIKGAPHD
jgi:uncharacterized protein YndB with AHSA1/START domain